MGEDIACSSNGDKDITKDPEWQDCIDPAAKYYHYKALIFESDKAYFIRTKLNAGEYKIMEEVRYKLMAKEHEAILKPIFISYRCYGATQSCNFDQADNSKKTQTHASMVRGKISNKFYWKFP